MCVCVRVCVLPVRISLCLSVYPYVSLSVRLSTRTYLSLSVCLPVCISLCPSVYPYISLSVRLSTRTYLSLSVCLPVCTYLSLSTCLPLCMSLSHFQLFKKFFELNTSKDPSRDTATIVTVEGREYDVKLYYVNRCDFLTPI